MKKLFAALPLFILSLLLFAGIASAHVVVYPKEATQGSYEKFTVRVPTEKDIPTVKVEVKIPADVEISRVEPKPGWKYDLTKESNKITSVLWTAAGDGLSSTEFGEFNIQGKIGNQATQIVWKAIQTYKDGSAVEWTGPSDSKNPASVTTVKPADAAANHEHSDQDHQHATAHPTESSSKGPWILSIVAVVLGASALIVSFVKKSSSR